MRAPSRSGSVSLRMLRTTSSIVVVPASAASSPAWNIVRHAGGDGGALDRGVVGAGEDQPLAISSFGSRNSAIAWRPR